MNDKKGILMPEVLKIILAALCIAALIYLAASLYGLTTKKTSIEQSRATLDEIESKINSLDSLGDNNFTSMVVTSPNGWYIVSFTGDEVVKPKLCPDKCVCVCEDYDVDGCNSGGLCRSSINKPVYLDGGHIEIDKAFNLEIKKSAVGISLKRIA